MWPLSLASLTWCNAFKVHPHCSLCQSFILFYCHLGPGKRRPMGQSQMQPRAWNRAGATVTLATVETLRLETLCLTQNNLAKALRRQRTVRGYTEEPVKYLGLLTHFSLRMGPMASSWVSVGFWLPWPNEYNRSETRPVPWLASSRPGRGPKSPFYPLEAPKWPVRCPTSLKLLCL